MEGVKISSSFKLNSKLINFLKIEFLEVVVVFVKNLILYFFLNLSIVSIDPSITLLSEYNTPSRSMSNPLIFSILFFTKKYLVYK